MLHPANAGTPNPFGWLRNAAFLVSRTALKQTLGVELRRYKILGACNPPFAHQALSADLVAGLLLPCNVVVYEGDDRRAVVMAVDPTQTVTAAGNPELAKIAETVKEKLTRAMGRLE